MTKAKALEKILADLGLPKSCEDYVLQTMGMLGCDDDLDRDTVKGVEIVIRQEMGR
jgi:hypothetical protein